MAMRRNIVYCQYIALGIVVIITLNAEELVYFNYMTSTHIIHLKHLAHILI